MSRETGAHFILFDDGESLEKKRTLAQELGISRFFLLYPEIAEFLPSWSARRLEHTQAVWSRRRFSPGRTP